MRLFTICAASCVAFVAVSVGAVAQASPSPLPGSTSGVASTRVACADADGLSTLNERGSKSLCVARLAEGSLAGLWGDTSDDALVAGALAAWMVEADLAAVTPQPGLLVIDGVSLPTAFFSATDAANHGVPALAVSLGDLDLDGEADVVVSYMGNLAGGAVQAQRWLYSDLFAGAVMGPTETSFSASTPTGSTGGNGGTVYSFSTTSDWVTDYGVSPATTTLYGVAAAIHWRAPRPYTNLAALQ